MSESIKSYRDLKVWQKAMDLVVQCYKLSQCFPDSERYGLVSQLRRAAVSIPANVAEGWGRNSTKDYIRFVSVAFGSLTEVETHLQIAERLGYINAEQAGRLLEQTSEVSKMLVALRKSLEERVKRNH